ncbi:MAG: enoyl-CoA hydratase/isomerase family protein [Deltaproteobacteria bacterium]|nr:enoyl-CoA hydratase/isomerase family protein [Deltaproteobacteria bacterium]
MARIRRVAVLGAGVMGSGIAAHVAGAGIPVLLLDIVPPNLTPEERKDRAARNRLAQGGRDKALAAKPALFFTPRDGGLVEVGNFEEDLPRLAECDWIIEAIKEELHVKRELFSKVEQYRRADAIVSSNTSGLPLADLVLGRGPEFRAHFLVTHFFNPVRYMHLLELVVGPETAPRVVKAMHHFGEEILGKGVVYAKDTPNFVANRIGTFAVMDAIQQMVEQGLSIEEVDAIHGRPLGHPKSAVFRTADIVGLDTLLHVAHNCERLLVHDEDRGVFRPPEFMEEMVKKGLLGDKSGGGFYRKTQEGLLALDWRTLEYRPQEKPRFESLGEARTIDDAGERIRAVVGYSDRAGQFAWKTLSRTLNYAAARLGEIADDVVNIDRALRWGFNWELGPFETLDALGSKETVARMQADGLRIAPLLREMATTGARFYPSRKTFRDVRAQGQEKPVPVSPRALSLPREDAKARVKENDSATLWDLGEDVLCVELHSKMNSVDNDVISMLHQSLDEAEKRGAGLVIGNESTEAFSAGANLLLILLAAREGQFKDLEEISRQFQQANLRLSHAEVPVVAAPFGLTLGGGAEMALAASQIRAHAELYMGLVEAGVGVVPAAGGCKEMVLRAMANVPDNVDPFLPIQRAFETVAMAKISTSAEMARDLGFLKECDRVTMSREQLLHDAKQTVLGLARAGWKRPAPKMARVPGEAGIANFKVALWSMAQSHQISEHDQKIASKLAHVMCGGAVAPGTRVSEQHLLDLEREAFLSLCGEPKSQERMQYMLEHNKPLRN